MNVLNVSMAWRKYVTANEDRKSVFKVAMKNDSSGKKTCELILLKISPETSVQRNY